MKKLFLTSFLITSIAANAWAHNVPVVTLGALIDMQVGFRNQKGVYEYDNLDPATGKKLHKYALVTNTKLFINADNIMHNGTRYGGKMTINADTSKRKTIADKVTLAGTYNNGYDNTYNAYRTMVYVENGFGRVEAGSTTGVYDAMRVNAATLPGGGGGLDGDARFWWHPNMMVTPMVDLVYNASITRPSLPSAYDTDMHSYASKISYFTPLWNGFRGGITYIPDLESHGTIATATGITKDVAQFPANIMFAFKDIWSGAVSWEGQFGMFNVQLAATGEIGDAKDTQSAAPLNARHDLRAWEIGGAVNLKQFTIAGSYGDWTKSGIAKQFYGKQESWYTTIGGSYKHGPFGASVAWMHARRGGACEQGPPILPATPQKSQGQLDNVSFGIDYTGTPGITPYGELSIFTNDNNDNMSPQHKNTGNVIIFGTKINI